ncbi:MAG: hypothetical protein Q7V48_15815 [Deltaproteobacteria bacterium]|nr:hypothetical protein [Deltaproteobacteria bacterium]
MISQAQEEYILRQAYVPEHVPNLMVGVSKGEPYLIGDYVIFAKDDWLIFVGYPLNRDCRPEIFATALKETIKKFNPTYTWFVAPEIPNSILQSARQREGDEYYKLEMRNHEVEKGLMRIVKKASEALTIEKSRQFSEEHVTLTRDFLERESPPLRVKELFSQMPGYVSYSKTSFVLNARDKQKKLSAYYVIELGAEEFATYVVGCFSRTNYVAHASDALFYEMINLAKENHKSYIHLGLGVNEGIRRFKRKWGGFPFLKYESGQLVSKPPGPFSWIRALGARL